LGGYAVLAISHHFIIWIFALPHHSLNKNKKDTPHPKTVPNPKPPQTPNNPTLPHPHINKTRSLASADLSPTPCTTNAFQAAFRAARAAGVLAATAAGNSKSTAGLASPACATAAVSVGAVYDSSLGPAGWGGAALCTDSATSPDQITCFSNSADYLGLLAPGAMITGGGVTYGGTSQAAPHVAGAIAVLKGAR